MSNSKHCASRRRCSEAKKVGFGPKILTYFVKTMLGFIRPIFGKTALNKSNRNYLARNTGFEALEPTSATNINANSLLNYGEKVSMLK